MFVTRKAEFAASHVCRLNSLSEDQNRALYGEDAHQSGHGHNFIVEVTVEGDPHPVTGMVIDLSELKNILEDEIITPMDHRFLNFEVAPFDTVVPTTANVAREIWRRVDIRMRETAARLSRVRLFETSDLYVDVERENAV